MCHWGTLNLRFLGPLRENLPLQPKFMVMQNRDWRQRAMTVSPALESRNEESGLLFGIESDHYPVLKD